MDSADLSPVHWRKSHFSSGDGACVEVTLVTRAESQPPR